MNTWFYTLTLRVKTKCSKKQKIESVVYGNKENGLHKQHDSKELLLKFCYAVSHTTESSYNFCILFLTEITCTCRFKRTILLVVNLLLIIKFLVFFSSLINYWLNPYIIQTNNIMVWCSALITFPNTNSFIFHKERQRAFIYTVSILPTKSTLSRNWKPNPNIISSDLSSLFF